jgi:hypothetical protein
MIKWFAYIVLLLILTPCLSFANHKDKPSAFFNEYTLSLPLHNDVLTDTSTSKAAKHQQELDDKKKIKEIAKARRQPKPEKIDATGNTPADTKKTKPKRQRRPEGLERPPEIPRRND